MNKRFKNCVIHIGTEKTGTSTVQSFLNLNRKMILTEGIFYPETSTTQHGSQWEFVCAVHRNPRRMDVGRACGVHSEGDQENFKAEFSKDLEKQFRQSPNAETLLISSEHFHSRLNTIDMVEALKAFLEPWVEQFKVIVYLRRQDQLALSYYTTRIRSGAPLSAIPLPAQGIEKRYFDYRWLYETWAQVFSKDAIVPRLYEINQGKERGVLEDFCALVGVDLQHKKMPRWLNQSVNAAGLALMHTAHNYFKQNSEISADPLLLPQMIQYISEINQGRCYPFSRSEAREFYAQFEDDNEAVRLMGFPSKPAPLFNGDFSKYPVEADVIPVISQAQLIETIEKTKRHNQFRLIKKVKDVFFE